MASYPASRTMVHGLAGRPVIIPFASMGSLGFDMQPYTLNQLMSIFPENETEAGGPSTMYAANGGKTHNGAVLDLAPALRAISRNGEMAHKGNLRSFPRNVPITPVTAKALNVQEPPLVAKQTVHGAPLLDRDILPFDPTLPVLWVVSVSRCLRSCKCRKTMGMTFNLRKLCQIWGSRCRCDQLPEPVPVDGHVRNKHQLPSRLLR